MFRDPTLVVLSREHFSALAAAAHVEQAGRGANLEQLRDELVGLQLPGHFAAEEQALLPFLSSEHDQRLRIDHAALLDLLEQVQAKCDRTGLDRLAGLLREHVRWEERVLFPWLQANLSPSGWSTVAEILANLQAPFAEEALP